MNDTDRCPVCYDRSDELAIDRTGQRVCPACYVPTREELARVTRGTATEDVIVAPPNARNVTPLMLVGQMLTLTEAAGRLGLSPSTLRVQIGKGKLRGKKVGRDWTVSEREVARYAAESKGRHVAASMDARS